MVILWRSYQESVGLQYFLLKALYALGEALVLDILIVERNVADISERKAKAFLGGQAGSDS